MDDSGEFQTYGEHNKQEQLGNGSELWQVVAVVLHAMDWSTISTCVK